MSVSTQTTQQTMQTKANHSAPSNKVKSTPTPKPLTPVTPTKGDVQIFTAPHRHLYIDTIAQALRIAGQGTKVLLVQPFQAGIKQGLEQPRRLVENLLWLRCDAHRDISHAEVILTDLEKASILELWQYAKSTIASAEANLVVIDQANLLIDKSLITEEELLQVLEMRSPKVQVILTGTAMPARIAEYADQVTHRRN
ncbi:MAG: cob(I)yrinic acid a,c-diamide adenosyltransferase [Pseudanabaenaceae cyanobacterium bins.39]|nr:cob(I)yrinic acid a,c-diamide adenosyltransferase [Pseudanabaenaceae cyanobacterium bins.39]